MYGYKSLFELRYLPAWVILSTKRFRTSPSGYSISFTLICEYGVSSVTVQSFGSWFAEIYSFQRNKTQISQKKYFNILMCFLCITRASIIHTSAERISSLFTPKNGIRKNHAPIVHIILPRVPRLPSLPIIVPESSILWSWSLVAIGWIIPSKKLKGVKRKSVP